MHGVRSFLIKAPIVRLNLLSQQTRNTFVLKRWWPLPLHKKGGRPTKFKARHFIYDLIEDTNNVKQPDIKVVLKEYIAGVGNVGDLLVLRPNQAYRDYLLPGLAVYASPENIAKYKVDDSKPKEELQFSSVYAQRTMNCLSRLVLQITMNKLEPWKLEPWHVRTSFRKAGFVVPEHAIEMPPIQIRGPDLKLQEKEFYVTVTVAYESTVPPNGKQLLSLMTTCNTKGANNVLLTINKKEKVNVRCRIHHWATGLDRLPWEESHWKKPMEALIPEQAAVLEKMPLPE